MRQWSASPRRGKASIVIGPKAGLDRDLRNLVTADFWQLATPVRLRRCLRSLGGVVGCILLTGASGFIGGHLLERIQSRHEIVTLGRHQPRSRSNAPLDWVEHDLRQPLVPERLPAHVDTVVHLAQSQEYRQFPERAQEIFAINVQGTLQLLDYARAAGARQFIFASSGGVYRLSQEPIPELAAIEPMSFYLATKYASEILLKNYGPLFETTVLRLFFVYGAGQQSGMLIPSLARRVRNREVVTIEGNPGVRINPIHVDDATRVIEAAVEMKAPDIVNVAGDEVVSITELVEHIGTILGTTPIIEYAVRAADGNLIADTGRMKGTLGIAPRVSLADGLRATLLGENVVASSC